MKLSKQQLKTSTRYYIKKCAGAVCTSKLHESARNSRGRERQMSLLIRIERVFIFLSSYVFHKRQSPSTTDAQAAANINCNSDFIDVRGP